MEHPFLVDTPLSKKAIKASWVFLSLAVIFGFTSLFMFTLGMWDVKRFIEQLSKTPAVYAIPPQRST